MIKAVRGGGGKGMRISMTESEFEAQLGKIPHKKSLITIIGHKQNIKKFHLKILNQNYIKDV